MRFSLTQALLRSRETQVRRVSGKSQNIEPTDRLRGMRKCRMTFTNQ
jgi:hypothetical protein